MSLNFSAVIGSQIRQLILGVSKKNFQSTSTELRHVCIIQKISYRAISTVTSKGFLIIMQLIEQYGTDCLLFVLRTLINQVEFRGPRTQTKENQARLQLLAHEVRCISL